MIIPKVAAIHDLSCIGRCSLSVIIPIMSKLSLQVCPLPTSILSSHLGGYSHVSVSDGTSNMRDIYTAWQLEKLQFDYIYTGYFDSPEQIITINDFMDKFSHDALIVIDPVMGDNGRLYSKYTPAMQLAMQQLIERADIITPNYTEACLLLDEQFVPIHDSLDTAYNYLIRLAAYGIGQVIITGIHLSDGRIANVAYDSNTQIFYTTYSPRIPVHYPGCGDIFTSTLLGYISLNYSLDIALSYATQFVYACIDLTYKAATPSREGVLLELLLDTLTKEGIEQDKK